MKYDLKAIMSKAWELFRKAHLKITDFAEALRRAWALAKCAEHNESIVEEAIKMNGITEKVRTWYGWYTEGREVIHESKCLFQVTVNDPTRGIGKTKVLSFFGLSQTAEIVA